MIFVGRGKIDRIRIEIGLENRRPPSKSPFCEAYSFKPSWIRPLKRIFYSFIDVISVAWRRPFAFRRSLSRNVLQKNGFVFCVRARKKLQHGDSLCQIWEISSLSKVLFSNRLGDYTRQPRYCKCNMGEIQRKLCTLARINFFPRAGYLAHVVLLTSIQHVRLVLRFDLVLIRLITYRPAQK